MNPQSVLSSARYFSSRAIKASNERKDDDLMINRITYDLLHVKVKMQKIQSETRRIKRYKGNQWAATIQNGRVTALIPPGRSAAVDATGTLIVGSKADLHSELRRRKANADRLPHDRRPESAAVRREGKGKR